MKRAGSSVPGSGSSSSRQVPVSALSLLVNQTVRYLLQQVSDTAELERKLENMGRRVGYRVFDLYCIRHNMLTRREQKIVPLLQFVADKVWRGLFGRPAEVLKGEQPNEYQLAEKENLFHLTISTTECNLAAYQAGMVEAMLSLAGFHAKVSAHHTNVASVMQRGLILLVELQNGTES